MGRTKILQVGILSIFLMIQGCGIDPKQLEEEVENTKCNGTGTITYSNSTYVGECKDGKREGQGVLTFDSGQKYDGEWHNDREDGKGTYYYGNSIYIGEWKDGKKEGLGVFEFDSGEKYDGEWKDGKKEGEGKKISQYGICAGIWIDGELTEVTNQDSYEEAYSYYNKIRKQAGMIELEPNGILQEATQSHSNYLTSNLTTGHDENQTKEEYTGTYADDRAIKQGYFSNHISEVISYRCTVKESMNGLMTAIYHRFIMLRFNKSELGVGFTQDNYEVTRNLVLNLGNYNLNELCQNHTYLSGSYYSESCSPKHKIEAEAYSNAIDKVQKTNPKYILWPPNNSVNNLYEFNGESPDPMPDYNQTGNPISIQFNDYYYPNTITMQSFKLFKNGNEIKETRILTEDTDPNNKFSEHEFALFPLDVLERDTTYMAIFEYRYNGVVKNIEWSFETMK